MTWYFVAWLERGLIVSSPVWGWVRSWSRLQGASRIEGSFLIEGRLLVEGVGPVKRRCRPAPRIALAIEHDQIVAIDLSEVALVPILIEVRARFKLALDIEAHALMDVLVHYIGHLPPEDHAVPLGLFLELAVRALERLIGHHRDLSKLAAVT